MRAELLANLYLACAIPQADWREP